ncbi:hypothetical protein AB0I22_23970 [Streptomyces sp. NPDC050610]|uniref:imidazolonepropionase-like domain-containing protein n=1 Tax=Streptomyces sp. NPDC050610 TaxID=3157097 RepID=UPI0034170B43
MLTIHRVREVRLGGSDAPVAAPVTEADAVLVSGDRIEDIGPYERLRAEHGERARVREWDGVLAPGRYEPDAAALLEAAYHPDPREADELGTEPVTGAALVALAMTDVRWGGSARRGLQRLLAAGTTALTGPFERPPVRKAVERSGLRVLPASPESPALRPGTLTVGGPADFAVFAADGSALATVLGGRLVHRRR